MPTRNVSLSPQQDDFVDVAVKSGRYGSASEVVRDALRRLETEVKADELRLERLKGEVARGAAAIAAGDFETVAPDALADWLDAVDGS